MKAALHGVADDFRHGRGKSASRKFRRAANVFEETTNQLATLEPPAADAALITQWLGMLRSQIPLARRVSRVLQHEAAGKKIIRALNALYRRSDRTQALVADYGFSSCKTT